MNEQRGSEARHPIGVVVERTGLKADVLRVWERRYGVVQPRRDTGGRRLYSDADIERLRLLGKATVSGRSIGQVAGLTTEALAELTRADDAARLAREARRERGTEGYVGEALERVGALDGAGLESLLRRGIARLGWPVFLEEVLAPLFRRVGEEWHAGRLTPAHEHLASAVVRSLLGGLANEFGAEPGAPTMVVATPPGERHEIGALLAAGTAVLENWKVVYLGPDLPVEEIARAARQAEARAVAVSAVYVEDPAWLLEQMRLLRGRLPADVWLLLGGSGARALEEKIGQSGVAVLSDLSELRRLLETGLRHG
jgi:MerR family transcriptional regulator, light-induced transcriptional regulator